MAVPPSADPAQRPETLEQTLTRLGFDWFRLERLARKALQTQMARRGITLDEQRYQEALDWHVEAAARWARRFDPDLARGQSFATSCYRQLTDRDRTLTDYLRDRHGDSRRGNPIYETTTSTGELPEREAPMDADTFDQLVEHIRPRLKGLALKALAIARDYVVEGLPSVTIAARHGIEQVEVFDYLECFGHQLGYRRAT